MKNTKIIAAFPGTGKSYLYKHQNATSPPLEIKDSDSSNYPKANFPINYLDDIESTVGQVDILLISTHSDVLAGLEERGILYTLIHPDKSLKIEYLERYLMRGSPASFIKLLDDKWSIFMGDLEDANPTQRITLSMGQYISDVLPGVGNQTELSELKQSKDADNLMATGKFLNENDLPI